MYISHITKSSHGLAEHSLEVELDLNLPKILKQVFESF